jgi:hypothetical protein
MNGCSTSVVVNTHQDSVTELDCEAIAIFEFFYFAELTAIDFVD